MKIVRSFLCVIIALILLVTSFPISDFAIDANAANVYVINGKSVRYTDFSSSPNDCWNYANNIYNKIWGQKFNNSFGDSNNSLRNLNDDQLILNAENLKSYVSHAALGSCLRICNRDYLHGTDGLGHSQIIVQKDANGFTVFEGGLSASPYNREKYYTWSEYCNTGWLGGTYQYIKYIKWPNASAYSSEPTNSEVKKLIKESYPSHCTIKITENNKTVKSLPCSNSSDANSIDVESAPKGTTYEAIELIQNKWDNLWYKVKAKNGKEGYIFAGNASFVSVITSDITGPGISVPANHTQGKTYILTGSVNSSYNELTNVSAYIYSGNNKVTGGSSNVSGKSYSLGRSTIDNQTKFNVLSAGQYTYKVTASYKNYYAKSDKSYGAKTGTVTVYSQNFNVISGSVVPDTPQQPTTIIYPDSGGIYKISSGVGSNMYLDFSLTSDNVQIYENCDGHSNPAFVKSQYFKLTHVGDGWYSIVNIGNGIAMDVDGANPASGTNIHQWTYDGNNAQLFRFYDAGNGYCYIKSKLGTYVDVVNGDSVNNTNVWAYAYNGSNAQIWKLENHIHSYNSHYEAEHPHRVYKKCICGDWYYTGKTQSVYSCSACISEEPTTENSNDTNSGSNPVLIIKKGDIDGNGNISSSDARLTLRASVGLEKFNNELIKRADIDKDNTVSAADARLILRASVKLENPSNW